jgi:biopolymer transport protein ExbB
LLGTASGLVVIFGNTEDLTSGVNNAKIGAGIARALGTTIAGLVVAVPSVVAHSYFTRKIETMSARLEVLLGIVVSALQQSTAARVAGGGSPVTPERQPPLPPELSKMP